VSLSPLSHKYLRLRRQQPFSCTSRDLSDFIFLILFNNPHCSVQFTQFFRLLFDSLRASHENIFGAAAITDPKYKNRFLFVFWFSSHLSLRVQNLGRLYRIRKEEKRRGKYNLILTRHFFMTLIVSFSFALVRKLQYSKVFFTLFFLFSKVEMRKPQKNRSKDLSWLSTWGMVFWWVMRVACDGIS
jgi:hypothetical protein